FDIVVQPKELAVHRNDRTTGARAKRLRQAIRKGCAFKGSDEGMLEQDIVEGLALRYPAHDDRALSGADDPVFVNRSALGFAHAPHAAQAVLVNESLEVELRSRVVTHTADVSGALRAEPATLGHGHRGNNTQPHGAAAARSGRSKAVARANRVCFCRRGP